MACGERTEAGDVIGNKIGDWASVGIGEDEDVALSVLEEEIFDAGYAAAGEGLEGEADSLRGGGIGGWGAVVAADADFEGEVSGEALGGKAVEGPAQGGSVAAEGDDNAGAEKVGTHCGVIGPTLWAA